MLSWRDGVSAEAVGAGLRVEGHGPMLEMRPTDPAVVEALARLGPSGDDADALADLVLALGGPEALAAWYFDLQRLARRGLVRWSVRVDGRPVATLAPIAAGFASIPTPVAPDRRFRLSRFAFLRRVGDVPVLESPMAHARVVLDDPRAAGLVASLAMPGTAEELAGRAGFPAFDAVPGVLGLLAAAGMVRDADREAEDDEGGPSPASIWEFHDLLFHARSRKGRSDAPFGATYRLAGRVDPPPALKPESEAGAIDLHRPDPDRLVLDDPPLARVMEHRRSIRDYGDRPITAGQLGEFLYRVARVVDEWESVTETPAGPVASSFATRPFPSGGALYELEFHVLVAACDGLAPGLYAYEPRRHRLAPRRGPSADTERLLRDAAASAGIPAGSIQVVIVLAARTPRLAWKYSSIAYALILKHVGVVYQTMYLAATAMGLAPCALGGGDSDLFARASGLDYLAETSVGEFLLGSRPDAGPDGRIESQEDRARKA